jgi:YihY family inner membrane protein
MNEPSPKQGSMMVGSTIRPRPAAPLSRPSRLGEETRRVWAILCLAVKTFVRIDGAQWAGAFAFNVFFSLFPLMILLVTIASSFVDRDRAGKEVIAYMESYVPISGEMQRHIFDAIAGVIKAREQVGAVAFLILVWAALQCFTSLVCATNRAWGNAVYNWWRLPLKSLLLLGITTGAVLLSMAVPVLAKMTKDWLFPVNDFRSWVYALGGFVIPLLVVFLSLSLFYRLAPRRPTQFAQVWVAALCATALLQAAESLFVIYLKSFARLNAVYGAFGGIMALLLWIYVSGCIFIFGACLCAAQAEGRSAPAETIMALNKHGAEQKES